MTGHHLWRQSLGAALVLACGVVPLAGLRAEPVVQALPGGGASSLNAALSRLARNPRDVDALIAAGDAALALGDNGAAAGFFARADALAPNNGAVLAGLAAAKVRVGDPYAAIPLFDTAEKAGAIAPERLADRGLAYDMVGDNARAQTWYRQAMAGGASDEAARRLGLSQAIAGDRRGAEATLSPLLQKNDRAAWRARAFSLAILGKEDEAVAIAQSTMPAPLAQAISPYLRYMRQLTPAQQAGAANLGRFPRAAEIGHDDPRVAAFAPRTRLAASDERKPSIFSAAQRTQAQPVAVRVGLHYPFAASGANQVAGQKVVFECRHGGRAGASAGQAKHGRVFGEARVPVFGL